MSSSTYSVITSAVVTSTLPPLLTSVDVERSVVLDGTGDSVRVVEIVGLVDFGPVVVVLVSTFFFSSRDCSFFWEALEAFSLFLLLLSFSIVFFSSSSSLP